MNEVIAPNSSGPPNWHDLSTEQRRGIIRPLWLEGKSAGDIAKWAFINASRNAVIGYVSRMKLSRGKVTADPNPRKSQPKPRPTPARIAKADSRRERVDIPEDDMPRARDGFDVVNELRDPIAGAKPLTLMELPFRATGVACRFPVKGGFCGLAPDHDDAVYCGTHTRLATSHKPPSDLSTYREPVRSGRAVLK